MADLPITIADARAIREVAERQSFGAAARALGVTSQAVAKRIQRLEALARVPLFVRSNTGVELTSAGRQVEVAAVSLLAEVSHFERVLRRVAGGRAQVGIAVSPTLADAFLIPALWKFEHRPGPPRARAAVSITMANSSEVREDVADRRADLGIAGNEPEFPSPAGAVRLSERPLLSDDIVVAVGPDHEWAVRQERGEPVFIDEVARTRMATRDAASNVRQVFDVALRERELELADPIAEVGSARLVTNTALEEKRPALLSRVALRDNRDMVIVQLYEQTPDGPKPVHVRRQFRIVCLDWDLLSDEARTLVDFLVEAAADEYGPPDSWIRVR